jgi:hypothetical protein
VVEVRPDRTPAAPTRCWHISEASGRRRDLAAADAQYDRLTGTRRGLSAIQRVGRIEATVSRNAVVVVVNEGMSGPSAASVKSWIS